MRTEMNDMIQAVVADPGATECAAMEANIATTLPELIGGKPQAYAAKCATVVPFGANI
jgi:hypothetical protein